MDGLVITPEIEHDAQLLAERMGLTPTEAVADALRVQLNREIASEATEIIHGRPPKDIAKIREILARIQSLPVDMTLTEDEILGYDEFGVPEQPYLGR